MRPAFQSKIMDSDIVIDFDVGERLLILDPHWLANLSGTIRICGIRVCRTRRLNSLTWRINMLFLHLLNCLIQALVAPTLHTVSAESK